jgi:hypothetical protein
MSLLKSTQKNAALLVFTAFLVISNSVLSQCVVTSNAGYSVQATICPKSIVVSSTSCPWGYNYNVNFDYTISFVGVPPANLYTLQTEIICNNLDVNGYYSLPVGGGTGNATTTTNPYVPVHNNTANNYGSNPSCTQATVSNLNCNSVRLKIKGPGIPNQEIDCNCNFVILPVTFKSFTVSSKSDYNELIWTTETENRNDYFTLEYSTDAISWQKIEDVDSKGDSQTEQRYSFFDYNQTRATGYYKLSQTDLDGNRNELAITYAQIGDSELSLFPNPSQNEPAFVQFTTDKGAVAEITVVNARGEKVSSITATSSSANGNLDWFSVELPTFEENGVFFIQVVVENQLVGMKKWVKI